MNDEPAPAGGATPVDELAEALPDGLLVLDEDLVIVRTNRRAGELFEAPADVLVGMDVAELFRGVDVTEARRSRRFTAETLGGRRFPAEISQSHLHQGGRVLLVRDVTDVAELEVQLRQAQKMESLGRLAGGISHDFNNYLTVILGEVELMASHERDPEKALDRIREAAEKAAGLTTKLLSFSREQILQRRPVDLNQALAAADRLIRNLAGEHITTMLALGSSGSTVVIDESQFEQALINIVLNARDAMPSGGKLTIETTESMLDQATITRANARIAPGRYVVVTITDTGSGIPPSVLEHIFEPFYTTKPADRGTGLGLAMVKGFIEQSDGMITVESTVDAGTTVRIHLPVVDEEPHVTPTATDTTGVDTIAADQPSGRGRVVVAEDDDAVRQVVSWALSHHGYDVVPCSNASDALSELADDIDVLVTDIVMPGGSGLELVTAATARFPHLRVVYMTGYADQSGTDGPIPLEGHAVLRKPFSVDDLLDAVRLRLAE